MFQHRFFCIVPFFVILLLSACSTSAPQEKRRFFFPPPPLEPKIEYIKAYYSDYDVKPEKKDFLTEYVIGETLPRALFSTPVDVASDGKGKVFVADSAARQVFVLDLVNHNSRILTSLRGGKAHSFATPLSVTVSDDGKLYVSDVVAQRVDVFDAEERYLFSLNDPGLIRPTAVAVDMPREIIYVVDTASHRLALFGLEGKLIGYFGSRGSDPEQFNFPTDVDVDDQGHIYVLDSLNARVQVFDETGAFLRMFGERGTAAGSFEMPKNLAVSNSGQVYVTDALAHKVVVFSKEGELLLRLGGRSIAKKGVSPGGFYLPRGIDVDAAGGLWVIDSLNRILHQFQFLTPQYLIEHPISQGVSKRP